MNILFVCTSNRDRSPSLERYFRSIYPTNEYRSAGVNKWFTTKKNTHYITVDDIQWSDLIVCAEDVHHTCLTRDFKDLMVNKRVECLNLGEYEHGDVGQIYLDKAVKKLVESDCFLT